MKNIYEFNEKEHIHTLNGKPLFGVTTVLAVISKPSLIQWSANMAVDYIDQNFDLRCWDEIPDEDGKIRSAKFNRGKFLDLTKEARTAHRKKKESAGDWGTVVHKAIECWVKKEPFTIPIDDNAFQVIEKFKAWASENKVEFLESEKHIWSKKLWIGGIVDLVIKMDGKKYIADIKTSSGIYNEAFFQMGAYNLCLSEMGEHKDVEGYLVINLKKDGTMDMKMALDMEQNKQAFKHALGLYKIINSLK